MKVLHERVAGGGVHKKMIKVAVRSPGDKPWARKTEILTFGTFYGVLRAMARELRRRGVTHVAMEASGVYAEPVYYALCEEEGFAEVLVVNPAHAKALRGHKTGARDCARIAELLECGLLQGSSFFEYASITQEPAKEPTCCARALQQACANGVPRRPWHVPNTAVATVRATDQETSPPPGPTARAYP